ncbi:hypothetical protein [Spirosoma sp.]|uniref:hypothetical protein n=1 Tax=Spirosoma sp. TaxID=1899569 RepID=UPI00261A536B|nr:hypothetical protein [Spirosoma sp.]MCX6217571.1 hypothetical protein [Spirosoma sp.]
MFKYLPGHPRQYRFDAKEGVFNINGDVKTSFKKLVFQPFAWRIFTDNILNMGTKNWAEMYFIDSQNCVSAILFHGYSVDNIYRLIEPLFYDDLTLADVIITCSPEKKENTKIQPKGVYYIAEFEYESSNSDRVKLLHDYSSDYKMYRMETLTDVANIKVAHQFWNPYLDSMMNGSIGEYVPSTPAPETLFVDQPNDGAI